MTNKPKFHILANSQYAIDGLKYAIKSETSFKIEVVFFVVLQIAIIFFPIPIVHKMILSITLFVPLIAELCNSAIERVVDMYTTDFHQLAKEAKDIGSSVVFVSIAMVVLIWIYIFILNYSLNI